MEKVEAINDAKHVYQAHELIPIEKTTNEKNDDTEPLQLESS